MNRQKYFLQRVAESLTRETIIVPLGNGATDREGYKYGLVYPFMCNDDVYYVRSLDHGTGVVRNELSWYARDAYGVAKSEIYDLITIYQEMVLNRLKELDS